MKKSILRQFILSFLFCFTFGVSFAEIHTVEKGETILSIANLYNTTPEKIIELNPDAAQFIYVGMELEIPLQEPIKETNVSNPQSPSQPNVQTKRYLNTQDKYDNLNNEIFRSTSSSTDIKIEDDKPKHYFGIEMTGRLNTYKYEKNDYVTNTDDFQNIKMMIIYRYNPIGILYLGTGLGYSGYDKITNTITKYPYETKTKNSKSESHFHCISLPVNLGIKFPKSTFVSIYPYIGLDMDFCVAAKSVLDGEKQKKTNKPETGLNFKTGLNLSIGNFEIIGRYNIPLNKKGPDGDKNYFSVGFAITMAK